MKDSATDFLLLGKVNLVWVFMKYGVAWPKYVQQTKSGLFVCINYAIFSIRPISFWDLLDFFRSCLEKFMKHT